jgi:glycosyltransferase involved in cell wall biosynthesis
MPYHDPNFCEKPTYEVEADQMKKLTVMIVKSSPWKSLHLFRDHPEYAAIISLFKKYKKKIRFILVGSSTTPSETFDLGDDSFAVDIQNNSTLGYLKYNLELIKLHLKYKPNLTIVLGLISLSPAIYSIVSRKFRYVPLLLGEFGYHGQKVLGKALYDLYLRINSFFIRLSHRNILKIFAISTSVRDIFIKSIPALRGRVELVSYPIPAFFSSNNVKPISKIPEEPLILTVAGIEPRKGLDVLVKAVSLLQPRPKVVIKGSIRDPVYALKLRRLVKSLKLEDSVTFITDIIDYAELRGYYKSATLFVFPTRDDSLGVVVLEALHSNLPVIATNVGGIPDMITNGENGVLIRSDDECALADAISLLLKDNSKREYLANNAKSLLFAKYYSPRITIGEALKHSVEYYLNSF